MIKHDTSASIDFLKKLYPNGPWVLTAINTDRKAIQTVTFHAENEKDAFSWIEKYQNDRNIYYHLNKVNKDLFKKAEREDIESVHYLHVDIDPRPGEDIEEEQQRALKLLEEFSPSPTAVIFSGGGYQALWALQEPIPINGDIALAEEAKRYNIQLEIEFGADNCHNIDRILRLPGTVNVPDSKKKRKGRKAALAELLYWHDDRIYELDKFTPAQLVQNKEQTGFGGQTVKISGNIERLDSVDELPDAVPDWVKVLIVQGHIPDNPTKYPSRSEALFAVCCELVRANVEDEVIFAVITDPDFSISSSILEKGTSAEKYAIRQIERAREDAIDPWLRKLNEKHAVISDIGGRCKVITEVFDYAMKRSKISRQSFEDFRNRYMNKHVIVGQSKEGKPLEMPVGKWWLQHPSRREYETIVFAPGVEMKDAFNLWKGFACEARPGNCDKFLTHVKENICENNQEYFDYIMGWMARAVQKPDTAGQTAIVLRGKMGTGKSFFAKVFGSLWGRHFLQVSDPKHLVGSFNAHLRDCVVLFGDEAFFAGDKKHESVLKMLITEELITIEAKGIDAEAAPNFTHIIMASNDSWVVPAGANERRFFVLDVSDKHMQDSKYFRDIKDQLENGGREALLHTLLTYDLTNFEVRKVPKTAALQEQKLLSLSPEEEWWFRKLEEGRIFSDQANWQSEVEKDELIDDYLSYSQRVGIGRRATATALGRFLNAVCPGLRTAQRLVTKKIYDGNGFEKEVKKRPYFYLFPDLEFCRKHWDENFGGPYIWPVIEQEEQQKCPF